MTALRFHVPGAPFAKRRPRFGRGRTYVDPETAAAEHAVAWYARRAVAEIGWEQVEEGAVGVEVRCVFAMPPSWTRRRREAAVGTAHASRPDVDNLAKLVLDALNGAGVWLDDAQVAVLTCGKRWARDGEPEGTSVVVEAL